VTSLELLSCLILIFISAYMAASEIGLFSLSRFQLRSLKESFPSGYRKMKQLLSDPGGLLITILVVNEVVNISLSTLITGVLARLRAQSAFAGQPFLFFPSWAADTLCGLLVTAPIILFFGEITPKVIAARANQLVATITVGPLSLIYRAFGPVRRALKRLVASASQWAGDTSTLERALEGNEDRILKESDFLLMLEEGHREGAIGESELELIKNVFEFDDTPVATILTPISQVQTLGAKTTVRTAIQAMRSQNFSRVPVIGRDRKEVVGILYAKDLLRAKLHPAAGVHDTTIETLMRKPLFVPVSMRLNSLFRRFKQQKTHMAVVQGPNEEAIGIVTMSDVLETLLEDLFPEEEITVTGEMTRSMR
jgi:putative hemolysin